MTSLTFAIINGDVNKATINWSCVLIRAPYIDNERLNN